jgi:hypothetical protein
MGDYDDIYGDQAEVADVYGGADDDIYGDMSAGGGEVDDIAGGADDEGADIYGDIYGDASIVSQAAPITDAQQVSGVW